MSNRNDLEKLINGYERRLQKLKEKEAIFGLNVSPEILIEIEDIQGKIKKLRSELADLESSDKSNSPSMDTPPQASQDPNSSNEPHRVVVSVLDKKSFEYWSKVSGAIGGLLGGALVGVPLGVGILSFVLDNSMTKLLVSSIIGILAGAIYGWITGPKIWIGTIGIFVLGFVGAITGGIAGLVVSYSRLTNPAIGAIIGAISGSVAGLFGAIILKKLVDELILTLLIQKMIGAKAWAMIKDNPLAESILKSVVYIILCPILGMLMGLYIGFRMVIQVSVSPIQSGEVLFWTVVGIFGGGFLGVLFIWFLMGFPYILRKES